MRTKTGAVSLLDSFTFARARIVLNCFGLVMPVEHARRARAARHPGACVSLILPCADLLAQILACLWRGQVQNCVQASRHDDVSSHWSPHPLSTARLASNTSGCAFRSLGVAWVVGLAAGVCARAAVTSTLWTSATTQGTFPWVFSNVPRQLLIPRVFRLPFRSSTWPAQRGRE